MGDAEPIELRFDSSSLRRMRRMMKKMSMHVVAMARKPRTTITAIAQCGKPEPEAPDCTPAVEVGEPVTAPPALLPVTPEAAADWEEREREADSDAADAEATDDVDAIEATIESANVVSVECVRRWC